MRCNCCNVMLTPFESTVRNASTNEFMDMCESCLSYVSDDVRVLTREDLRQEVGTEVANYIDGIDFNGVNYE
ncbi:MAG: hypothetical protein QMA97_00435 [Glaciecola sp.]